MRHSAESHWEESWLISTKVGDASKTQISAFETHSDFPNARISGFGLLVSRCGGFTLLPWTFLVDTPENGRCSQYASKYSIKSQENPTFAENRKQSAFTPAYEHGLDENKYWVTSKSSMPVIGKYVLDANKLARKPQICTALHWRTGEETAQRFYRKRKRTS